MDFFETKKHINKGIYHVGPAFKILKTKDLMIRGRDFYAIYNEDTGLWSRDENDAFKIIDNYTRKYISSHRSDDEATVGDFIMDADSGIIDKWNRYVTKQLRDNYTPLDNRVIFSNTEIKREDYATHRLSYPCEAAPTPAYEELMSTLYDPDERKKLEWGIGSIVAGDSTWIQKFIVIVGTPGTGKGTFFELLRMLFPGYYATIQAAKLCNKNASFALEPLKNDPLVAIEDDTDLSHVSDNTVLNSIVSHEPVIVNEKFKAQYENKFHAFIFLGSNYDVKITDSSSGLTRRLIDVVPSGRKLDFDRYNEIMKMLRFELGGIAYHCLQVYIHNKKKYNNYIPVRALRATNLIYNFLEEYHADLLGENDGCRYHDLWNAYNTYCELSKVQYTHNRQEFRNELRPYFEEYYSSYEYAPGQTCSGYFKGFRYEKIGLPNPNKKKEPEKNVTKEANWLNLDSTVSLLDDYLKDYPAQYRTEDGRLERKWKNCKTHLSDINTHEVHHVKCPSYLICVDFDLKNENGEKDKDANLNAAKTFPPTYAEWSMSGGGLHLYYIYKGDVNKLSRIFDENIEIKVYVGDASLRRKLTTCNNIPIAEISGGLPLKEESVKMYDEGKINSERGLRTLILRALNKEIWPNTTQNMQFIKKILDEAYEDDSMVYDVRDLKQNVYIFAANATNQSDYCLKLFDKMYFTSKKDEERTSINGIVAPSKIDDEKPIIFYDIEVFPNLFIICWAYDDDSKPVVMINPSARDVENLYRHFKLIGFNNRKYDAHILYGRLMGYTNIQTFNQSQDIINKLGGMFSEAYSMDYADIYDFSSKKQGLKKWEIDMGITHLENAIPWDQNVPQERWTEICEYCCNDVEATRALFHHKSIVADWKARCLLSDLSALPVINTNRQHITKIIFKGDRKPNLVYTDLSSGTQTYLDGTPYDNHGEFINCFPGYEFNIFGIDKEKYTEEPTNGKSIYLGADPSEGGYVMSRPGAYPNVWCFDIGGLHPASIIAMNKFGEYTKIYKEIRDARIFIKHKQYDEAKKLLGGALIKYLDNPEEAKNLALALKLILNSTYGFCSATFDNPFKDPRDVDNIVAKRGALFIITLRREVENMGYTVIHCKTDSIKVVNPDKKIIDFINDFGHKYGYEFEVEAKYEKICLINRSEYIALEDDGHWSPKGAKFSHPYILKTLFTHEPIVFDDYCETKNVAGGSMYLNFNEKYGDLTEHEKRYQKLLKKSKSEKSMSEEENNELATLEAFLIESKDLVFVGRFGRFVPIKPGMGGAELLRESDGKYSAVTGTKGYRWMDAEVFKANNCSMDIIDKDYFRKLCDTVISDIDEYCNIDDFINGNIDVPWEV